MSNRFYVNDEQVFGNNEMFPKTYDELKKQGAEWTGDGTFRAIKIKDPQALMEAVEQDSLEHLKKALTEYVWSDRKKKCINKKFSSIHDKDLILSSDFKDELKFSLYRSNGDVRPLGWRHILWWISEKRAFTSFILYLAIKDDVELKDGKLLLKEGHTITACMY